MSDETKCDFCQAASDWYCRACWLEVVEESARNAAERDSALTERDEWESRAAYAENQLSGAFGLPNTIGPSEGEAKRIVDWLRNRRSQGGEMSENWKQRYDDLFRMTESYIKRLYAVEAELAFIKSEYTDADPETLTRDELLLQVNALKREREETEHAMHMRIRTGYDTTVADSWKAHCAKIEAQRDKALQCVSLILQIAFERGAEDGEMND